MLEHCISLRLLKLIVVIIFLIGFFAPSFTSAKVVINEIQVTGSKATDEFVELYNNGSEPVNLEGWRLAKKTATGNEYNLLTHFSNFTIQPGSFFVIGHTDFSDAKQVSYSTSQSIAKDNSVVLYRDAGDTIEDVVGMGAASIKEGNAATNPQDSTSIGRRSDGVDTNDNGSDFIVSTPTPGRKNSQVLLPHQNPPPASGGIPPSSSSATKSESDNASASHAHIVISEIFPNPVGSDTEGEWIELGNLESAEVDLKGWILEDSSGHAFVISKSLSSTTIPGGGFYTLTHSQTKISLNNDRDTVILKRPDASLADTVSYTDIDEGHSYARFESGFQETETPSNNASNRLTQTPLPPTQTSSPTKGNTTQEASKPKTNNNVTSEKPKTSSEIPNSQAAPSSPSPVSPQGNTQMFVDWKGKIRLSEVMVNPLGEDDEGEWFELENTTGETVLVAGIKIRDLKNENTLPERSVPAHGFFIFTRPVDFSLTLNNSKETLMLVGAQGNELDRVSILSSQEGVSLARLDGTWGHARPTPGAPNVSLPEKKENQSSSKKAVEKNSSVKASNSITVEGVVLVEPGIFGTRTIYIDTEKQGYQVYLSSGTWPALGLGESVRMSGALSLIDHEPRIRVKLDGIARHKSREDTNEPEEPMPEKRAVGTLVDEDIGRLFMVTGEVVEVKLPNVFVADESGELKVYFKSTAIREQKFTPGDTVEITGILSKTKTGLRLLPRYPEDMKFVQQKVLGDESAHERSKLPFILLGGILILCGGSGWLFRKRIRAQYLSWKASQATIDDSMDD